MKYFVFSDIHGCINELKDSLAKAGYDSNNPNHYLLFLGDAFDHNVSGHYDTYIFLRNNILNNKLKWILGNHEIYLLNVLDKMCPSKFTEYTVRDIALGFDSKALYYSDLECIKVLKDNGVDNFIRNNCIDYFELDNYVFTHGFIPYNKKEMKYDSNWRNVDRGKWNYYRVLNGQKIVLGGISIPDKILVCGHIGSYFGNLCLKYPDLDMNSKEFKKLSSKAMRNASKENDLFSIYYGDKVIGIDGRAYDTHNVNILVIEGEEYGK